MAKAKSSVSRIAFYIVLFICVIAMAGFGITGIFTQSNSASVATVGDEDVTADSYFVALQNEINNLSQQFGTQLSIDQAEAFGVNRSVLQRLIQDAAMRGEVNRLGISTSDETIRDILVATRGLQGLDGNFDPDLYQEFLRRNRMSSAEYEDQIRTAASQQILADALVSGVVLPDAAITPIFEYLGESRSFNFVRLTEADILGSVPEPTEEQLATYYAENPDAFTQPLTRHITFAKLIPSELADQVTVPEEEVQALYEERQDIYSTPARRFAERIVFGSLDEANAAVAAIVNGTATFESIAEERGLPLDSLDIGEVTRGDLSREAADLLFETENPGVYGPAIDDLGPAIYRVNAAIAEQNTPLEEVYEELERDIAMQIAAKQIVSDLDRIVDLVAGGATPEELAESTDMVLGQIDWAEGSSDDIAAYLEFRNDAQAAEIGEERDIVELSDGGLLLLRVDDITEPFVKPRAEVEDQLKEAVLAENRKAKIRDRADQIIAAINASGGSLTDFANILELDFIGDVARTNPLPGMPANTIDTLFSLETGEIASLDDGENVLIIELWSTSPFDPTDADTQTAVEAVTQQRADEVSEDVLTYFLRSLITQAQPTINQARIDSLHLQLQ